LCRQAGERQGLRLLRIHQVRVDKVRLVTLDYPK
jgi:hypothetical protein